MIARIIVRKIDSVIISKKIAKMSKMTGILSLRELHPTVCRLGS